MITRGKYGVRLIENIRTNSDFRVSSIELPESLPDFIEDPGEFINVLELDKCIFSNDLIIAYILHHDLAAGIIQLAGENGAHTIIIAGGKSGSKHEFSELSKKYNIHIEVHEICCDIEKCGNSIIDEFASCFGRPEFQITKKKGIITDVSVICGAPCGSSWHAAKGLIDTKTDEAPARAGLLVQQYPCRAVRGTLGGIHKAAKLHKEAVEKALRENERKGISKGTGIP